MADNDNMKIWAQVCYTDPKHTKAVEFGRKFTSIDAHYQVMRATEVFGPVGDGWDLQLRLRTGDRRNHSLRLVRHDDPLGQEG